MGMRRTLLSFSIALPFAVLSVGACGGSAFEGGLGTGGTAPGSGGSNANAGTSFGAASGSLGVGGSFGRGGSSSTGGSANGGTGNVAGTGASAGSGGTDIQACTSNTDCEIEPTSCCSCSTGPVSNFTAINSKYVNQYNQRCGTVDCAGCPPTAFNPNDPVFYYVPTCQAGRCTVVDLHTTDITACSTAADCSVRSGTACCPGCAAQAVALNTKNEPELSKLVCGNELSACPGCAPPTPSGYSVGCADGRCDLLLTPCTAQNPCPL
jgi:hypothetical protein